MILFRGPCLLLCGPYYTVTFVLYDNIVYNYLSNLFTNVLVFHVSFRIDGLMRKECRM